MIYLENNNGTQQIFIPKNLNISINKTYDEGFQDGMKYQKEKLEVLNATENGVYKSDNGYKQVNVEVGNENVCKLEELNIAIVNDIEEYTATDSNLDGFSKVNVDASEFGRQKYEEGYEQGKSEGGEGGSCNISRLVEEIDVNEDGHIVRYAVDDGVDGWDYLDLDVNQYGDKKYNQGYEQGKSECGEGGSCNLDDLNVEWQPNWNSNVWYAENYGFDGYRAVSINAERALQKKYEEGYNQGKSECGEGGSCNIQNGSFEFEDLSDGHYWAYASDYGIDGWEYIDIDASNYGRQKYEEGYNQGKSECTECPELTELNVIENGTYEGSFNKVNVTVNATDFSSEQVENKYSHLSFITKNFYDTDTVVDKTKLLDRVGNYIENSTINITYDKIGICLAMGQRYLNPDSTTNDTIIRVIEDGAIDWNNVDIFRSYRITRFGENMTRDKNSKLSELYIQASTFTDDIVIFEDGCFATSNRLNKIVFLEPFRVNVKGNPFEGISSQGKFIVKGLMTNRDKYTDLINSLPSGWEVIFNPDYEG